MFGFAATGCSGSQADGAGGTCIAHQHTLASTYGALDVALSGSHAYFSDAASVAYDRNDAAVQGIQRVPLGGGAPVMLTGEFVSFAANDRDVVAWADGATLHEMDESGTTATYPLPQGMSPQNQIAVDAAGNVLLGVVDAKAHLDIVRFSRERAAFDVLVTNVNDPGGFFADGDGLSWIGIDTSTSAPALLHEDVAGGAPAIGPALPSDGNVIGLDANAVYVRVAEKVVAIDRASGTSTTALDLSDTSALGDSVTVDAVTMDSTHFYFLARGSENDTLFRAALANGTPERIVDAPSIESFTVGECSIVYESANASGSNQYDLIARPK
jgi:hypothetical protein